MSSTERRQQIVSRAAGLFDKTGYSSTTMDDIAKEVGVAKPTLYHYFPSKDDILHAIHEEFIDLLIDRHEARSETGLRAEQLLLEVMADILELMETHRGHVRVFFEHHRELPAEARGPIKAKRDRYERIVEDLIAAGVESGVFRQADPHLAALATFGMCNWAYQWYRPGGALRSRELAYQFWNYLVYGLGTDQLTPATARAVPPA
ncbi:TetR/AcrR family transcriptional regulator [Nocardioides abyssi]|uniref:TetR/AcrR family transcriptional regulator n=1 Tax=Nocardioides abyssi TaxID=3058370 RepID=A0ABT8EPW0_9ACTN|nr:TetR/AcrR family transcriptional regulator [Nocardioides abyssi]MDN4160190.1 TetR/AcrR family transcriptional regulator [Nocardioides abyssi]